jgi:hypothetical protein
MNPLESARWYLERGFYTVPVPYKEKRPVISGWQDLRITADNITQYYNGTHQNIGLLLERNFLHNKYPCDFDLDTADAHWAWGELGRSTGFIFGRKSNPASHHVFFSELALRTLQFDDPEPADGTKARILEMRAYGANGKAGLHTLIPGSTHPSGEPIEFVASDIPTTYGKEVLETIGRHIAAAVVLARHLKEGTRHSAFLALAGALARSGWHLEPAIQLVRAIYRVLWHDEADVDAAEKEVESTYEKYAAGQDTTGLRTLSGFLSLPVYRKITQWLGLREGSGTPPPRPEPQPQKARPERIFTNELKFKNIVMPESLIEDFLTTPGLYLVTAPSKAGKTILSVQMAMCLSNGLALFDYYKTIQTPTLLFEWDDPNGPASLRAMVEKCRAARDPMPFHFIHPGDDPDPLNFSDPDFLPYLELQITETGARFVILDSYTAMRGPRLSGGDIVKTESKELLALARIAHRHNCTILLIHHESKSSAQLSWADRGAGSYAVNAAPEGLIRISRFNELPEADPARLVSIRGRHLKGIEMALRFRQDTLDYDLILEGSAAQNYPELMQLHRAFPGISFTAKDISNELGWARTSTYRVLNRLTQANVFRRESNAWSWDPNFNTRYL